MSKGTGAWPWGLMSSKAVSYTHLDVYKRQIQIIGVKLIAYLAAALASIPAWAELTANVRDRQSGVGTPRLYAPAATITPYRLAANSADDNIMSRDALFDDVDDSLLKSGEKLSLIHI